MSARLVKLKLIRDCIPRSLKTLYNAHSAGRLSWLTRVGPDGRRSRDLWVDQAALTQWAADEGISLQLHKGAGRS